MDSENTKRHKMYLTIQVLNLMFITVLVLFLMLIIYFSTIDIKFSFYGTMILCSLVCTVIILSAIKTCRMYFNKENVDGDELLSEIINITVLFIIAIMLDYI